MPARAALTSRAHPPNLALAERPHARDVLRPELLAGTAGAPLEWARPFHRFFFDVAEGAVEADCLLVLKDVAIGRPTPLLREIQLWGATPEAKDVLALSSSDIAQLFSAAPDLQGRICTERAMYVATLERVPLIDDVELRSSMTAALFVSTTMLLARLSPYVRTGDGEAKAYLPSSMSDLLARRRRQQAAHST